MDFNFSQKKTQSLVFFLIALGQTCAGLPKSPKGDWLQDHMPAILLAKLNGKPQALMRALLEFTPACESLAQKKTQSLVSF